MHVRSFRIGTALALVALGSPLLACSGNQEAAAPDAAPAAPDAAVPPRLTVSLGSPSLDGWAPGFSQLPLGVAPAGVELARVELFVDGTLDREEEPIPWNPDLYFVDWDATAYTEDEHGVRVVAYLADGTHAEDTIRLRVDKSGPTITFLGTSVVDGKQVAHFDVTDEGAGLDYVSARVGDGFQALDAPPYDVVVPDCADTPVRIEATDLLGQGNALVESVRVVRYCDDDCDGHAAAGAACLGDDCNDHDVSIHPAATDAMGDFVDQDCDGLDGTDADGDGVPSVASGGLDCDDTNAAAHPTWWQWAVEEAAPAAPSFGGAVRYAALAAVGDALRFAWYDGHGLGYVERDAEGHFAPPVVVDADGYGVVQARGGPRLAVGPGGDPSIAYGATNQRLLCLASAVAGTFMNEVILPAQSPLFNVSLRALRIDPAGHRHLLMSSGDYGSGRYFTDASGAWTGILTSLRGDRIVDLFLRASGDPRVLYFRDNVDGTTDLALVVPTESGITVDEVLVHGTFDYHAASTQDGSGRVVVAYGDAAGSLHIITEGAPVVDLPGVTGRPVSLLAGAAGHFQLFVADGAGLLDQYVVEGGGASRVAHHVPGIASALGAAAALDAHGEPHIAVVGSSVFHAFVDRRIDAAPDAPGDSVDSDCDGSP